MRKKAVVFILIIYTLFVLVPAERVQAETNTEMNIYAMYLGDEEKGDSVLLESKDHYLLVDIGDATQASVIGEQLTELGAAHVDILFSHLHSDHIGGSDENVTEGLDQLCSMGITIDTLYLPSMSIATFSQRFSYRNMQLQNFASRGGCGKIVYLNTGDSIGFGDVEGQVIGPVDPWKFSPDQYTQYKSLSNRNIAYENDSSLAIIFACGSTRYFTAGDCYGNQAKALVEKYGDGLRCDIMKLCHHGIGTGNSAELLAAVRPAYSFATNSGVSNINKETGRWRTYTATKRASKYGMPYLVGNEKKTLIYHVENDTISLFRGESLSEGEKMTGWQYLYGADGTNRDHDMYYLNSACKPVKGVRKIGSHYYRFTAGGQMDYGSFSSEGEYLGWKTYSQGKRYYTLSASKKYAYMNCGFATVEGVPLYFDEEGYKVVSGTEDSVKIQKIGSNYYAVDYDGELTVNDWEEIDDFLYYFDGSGKMIRNCEYLVDGQYYLFDTDGTLFKGNGCTEFYDFKSNTYAVREDGTLVTNKCGRIDGDKYYFDRKGVIQKDKIIKIGRKNYYFGKDGRMLYNRNFKYRGKKYHSNSKGVISVVKKDKSTH